MNYYAMGDALLVEPADGAIEISPQQYHQAMTAKMAGRKTLVRDGQLIIFSGVMRRLWRQSDRSVKEIDENELIPEGYTEKAPQSRFDHWVNGQWQTDRRAQYIAEFDRVDDIRRGRYGAMVDPWMAEATLKRLQGKNEEASALERQAMAARDKIQREHPWPKPLRG